MESPWNFTGEVGTLDHSGDLVTLVEGSTFCLSDRCGNLTSGTHGLYFLEARLLSRFVLLFDGEPLQGLAVAQDVAYSASFVSRGRPQEGLADSDLLVLRRRYVGQGLREDLEVRNTGRQPAGVRVELVLQADFAHIFDVKQHRMGRADGGRATVDGDRLTFTEAAAERPRVVRLSFTGAPALKPDRAVWDIELAPGARWEACVSLSVAAESAPVPARYSCGEPIEEAVPARRLKAWRSTAARVGTDHPTLRRTLDRTVGDLGSLRVFDAEHPEFPVVAAGAPWYMTLFGRDSLLTGWMSLLVDPDLAFGSLETLARLQGTRTDPSNDEQPGRILHEVRTSSPPDWDISRSDLYYGSVDATPLFVMLLGEVHRWGLYPDRVRALLPAADRAIAWMQTYGDRDGDGYIEYERSSPDGLLNQGWKDSPDSVTFVDGTIPRPPIALCEVQGYAYAAYLARADLADAYGEAEVARDCRDRAGALRSAFNRDFWLPGPGHYAVALDGDKRPVDSLASNMAHCLWTGIADPEHAAAVADHLASPAMFTGWGVRTLATTMGAFNPLSYHNGSVWPHDNAIAVAGLARYGFNAKAQRLALATLAAAGRFDGRLPELFAGLDRGEVSVPVSYPSSCSPQAWASAAPLLMLRSLLHFDPDVPHGRLHLAPALPPGTGRITVSGIRIGAVRVNIAVADGQAMVTGLPDGVQVTPARMVR
jgi:glycogen debranching enzyme